MSVATRRPLFFSLRLRLGRIVLRRFRNFNLLLYLRYYRRTILLSPLSRTAVDNRSFFFDGSSERNRSSPGDSKNCSKKSGFHVRKQAETIAPSSRQRFLIRWSNPHLVLRRRRNEVLETA